MSGTDPTTPHPTESGAPGSRPPLPPASVPPARSPAPAVHVGGRGQAAPDDAPTSFMPALGAPPSATAAYDPSDSTRVAPPLQRPAAGGVDATPHLQAAAAPAPPVGSAPTRTPSYSARRPSATPPAGPYGGLYAGPLAASVGTVPNPAAAPQDPHATQVAGPTPVPPPPTAGRPAATASAATPLAAPPLAAQGLGAPPASAGPSPVPAGHADSAQVTGGPAAAPRASARRGSAQVLGRVEPRVAVLGGVVGLLVVVAVALGFTLFGGSGSPAVTPSAGASASAGTGGAAQPVVTEHFAAPSRNITCTMSATEATCTIARLAAKPTPVDGCDGTVGYVAKLGVDGKVETPCVARKDQPKVASRKVTTLAYGKSVTLGGLTCSSSATGVECRAKGTGKGFTIARAGIRTL